jgi:outer membrane protein assembly factor BamB
MEQTKVHKVTLGVDPKDVGHRGRGTALTHRPGLRWLARGIALALLVALTVAEGPIPVLQASPPPYLVFLPMVEMAVATPTPSPTPSLTPSLTPSPSPTPAPTVGTEWTQFAGNAQHTAYTPDAMPTPWRVKWFWNGPNSSGGVSAGKFSLPRNSQPVTGNGLVYVAAGSRGVYALNQTSGAVAWNRNPGGNISSTVAYDGNTSAVFAVSSNGVLYKLDASTGNTVGQFSTGSTSSLPLPPIVISDRVIFSTGNGVYAVNKSTLAQLWAYDAGSAVQTPPAYSAGHDYVVVVTQDLNVHAISNASGLRVWRTKPTGRQGGDPGASSTTLAEASYSWPVIAELHNLVFVKYRLDWQALWVWSPWPTTNAAMRSNLQSQPAYQALFALSLDTGSVAFTPNVGHGGWGDGGYLPMGPQPVVKVLPDGHEVAYVVMRGSPCLPPAMCDGRGDSRFGEMMLDNNTVAGYQAGDVRFMQNTYFPTDEQAFLSMAGDDIFGAHWMFGVAHQILDRSAGKGTGASPITTSNLPHIITSASNCGFSASYYCPNGLEQDGDPRSIPAGFYIYYNAGQVYDQYWRGFSAWVISVGTIYFVSDDGALVALENGNPTAASLAVLQTSTTLNLPGTSASLASPIAVDSQSPSGQTETVIPYTQARQYAGQTAAVEGVIQQVFNNGVAVYLGFKNPHQGEFVIRIMKSAWGHFAAPPETIYQVGQSVRVTGQITWYQGDPVMYVSDPSQINVATSR